MSQFPESTSEDEARELLTLSEKIREFMFLYPQGAPWLGKHVLVTSEAAQAWNEIQRNHPAYRRRLGQLMGAVVTYGTEIRHFMDRQHEGSAAVVDALHFPPNIPSQLGVILPQLTASRLGRLNTATTVEQVCTTTDDLLHDLSLSRQETATMTAPIFIGHVLLKEDVRIGPPLPKDSDEPW